MTARSAFSKHPGWHAPEHILALVRTYADKFVLLAEDGAHYCGKFLPSPRVPLPNTISPSPFEHPTSVSSCSCSLFQPIHPGPESFHTTPFYEVAARHFEDFVAKRATLETLRVFDMGPDVLVILMHDACLLDVLEFFPKADLAGWEMNPSRKDAGDFGMISAK